MLPRLQDTQFKDGYNYYYFSQRITLIQNFYDIYEASEGQLESKVIAFAQQKTFKLKEEINFFTDSTKSKQFFSFQARNILDFASVIDVMDSSGERVGMFKKDVGASLLRSTWLIQDVDTNKATLLKFEEKSLVLSLLRRVLDFIPLLEVIAPFIRTSFVAKVRDETVGSFVRGFGLKDTYLLEIRADIVATIGLETLLAQGVTLDTLQNR